MFLYQQNKGNCYWCAVCKSHPEMCNHFKIKSLGGGECTDNTFKNTNMINCSKCSLQYPRPENKWLTGLLCHTAVCLPCAAMCLFLPNSTPTPTPVPKEFLWQNRKAQREQLATLISRRSTDSFLLHKQWRSGPRRFWKSAERAQPGLPSIHPSIHPPIHPYH